MNNDNFITLLKKAETDDFALLELLEIVKPSIIKSSIINKKIDEDLRSELTAYVIELLHTEDFYKIIENYKNN